MRDIYLMCGIPGSGKSTFLKNHVKSEKSVIVSRDEIRFSFLKPGESYFSHEDEVLEKFWKTINEKISENKNVFIDQTSLTPKSRKYLLNHIDGYRYSNLIWIDEKLETCLYRNDLRKGTRAYVPEEKIINMYNTFIPPTLEEGFYRIYRYNTDDGLTYKGVI